MSLTGLTKQEQAIFEKAEELLQKGTTATELSQTFFAPDGKLRQLWNTKKEKEDLVRSALYQWLQEQVAHLRTQEAQAFEQEVKIK